MPPKKPAKKAKEDAEAEKRKQVGTHASHGNAWYCVTSILASALCYGVRRGHVISRSLDGLGGGGDAGGGGAARQGGGGAAHRGGEDKTGDGGEEDCMFM